MVAHFAGRVAAPVKFKTPGLYRLIRHPIYLGFIIAFCSTPTITLGHLLFASVRPPISSSASTSKRGDLCRYSTRIPALSRAVAMLRCLVCFEILVSTDHADRFKTSITSICRVRPRDNLAAGKRHLIAGLLQAPKTLIATNTTLASEVNAYARPLGRNSIRQPNCRDPTS